jgi:hypothetical protein
MSLLDEDIVYKKNKRETVLKGGELTNSQIFYTVKLWFLLWITFLVASLFIIIK